MDQKEAIIAALGAHAQWKNRLMEAVNKGESEWTVEKVKKDNECSFGQWLYNLPYEMKTGDDYEKVKELHAEFHKTAGEILQMALSGKKEEAMKKLEYGGGYGSISGKLVFALNNWKEKV